VQREELDEGRDLAGSDERPDVARSLRAMNRRRRCGVINRRLGWVVLPIVVTASVLHYGLGFDQGALNDVVLVLQLVFVPLVAVHAALSFYVFGWVPPSRTLRVFHVWFGYAYAVLVLASQTSFA
jgi:fatty acid desaturase